MLPQPQIDLLLSLDVRRAVEAHAMACYPEEACGAITPDGFVPLANVAPAEKRTEWFDCMVEAAVLQAEGRLIALVHSHPNGPLAPSAHDIAQQMVMDVPWGIVVCTKEHCMPPFFWGDMLPRPPLLGRMFRFGPSGTDNKGDCAALIRDWYLLERGILLGDYPRENGKAETLYHDNLVDSGFERVVGVPRDPGDVFLATIGKTDVPNHAGVYVGNQEVMHHTLNRYSRVEPLVQMERPFITDWMRYVGK